MLGGSGLGIGHIWVDVQAGDLALDLVNAQDQVHIDQDDLFARHLVQIVLGTCQLLTQLARQGLGFP